MFLLLMTGCVYEVPQFDENVTLLCSRTEYVCKAVYYELHQRGELIFMYPHFREVDCGAKFNDSLIAEPKCVEWEIMR